MTRSSSSSHARLQPPESAASTPHRSVSQRTTPSELLCWAKRSELRFDELPREIQDALCGVIQHRSYQSGEIIFRAGEIPRGLYRIDAGIVKVTRQMPGRPECLILDLRDRGESLGEETLFDDAPHATSAYAVEPVDLSFVPRGELWAVMRECPQFLEQLLAIYALRIQRAQDKLSMFYFEDVETRLAAAVIGLAHRSGQSEKEAIRFSPHFHRWDWAQLVGTRVETVGRIFRRWAEQGWIRGGTGHLILDDKEGLVARLKQCSDRTAS